MTCPVKEVLLVGEDCPLSSLVADFLTREGFTVKQEFRGATTAKRVELVPPVVEHGQLSMDRASRRVVLKGESIGLTSREFDLLWLLASKPGEVQTRDYIFKAVVGVEYDGLNRSVDVHMSRLRKKVGDDTKAPFKIKTIQGKGYLFVSDVWGE